MNVLDRFRLDGKRALITGGTRGLGRAMAQALGEAGADLVLVGTDPNNLLKAHDELLALGRRVDLVEADLFSPDATQKMCERVLGEHGPIDILINNVGGRRQNIATEEMPLDVLAAAPRSEPDQRLFVYQARGRGDAAAEVGADH